MQSFLQQLGSGIGVSEGTAGLLIGIVVGFVLRSLARLGNASTAGASSHSFSPSASQPKPSATIHRQISGGGQDAAARIALNVNGQIVEIQGAQVDILLDQLRRNNKIQAIKLLREASGLGLKDAKDIVEVLEKQLPPL